jgi:acyl-CoA oxidase
MIGCYAQTELGHGSDIQRLQTTATYDLENETFIINSPTIESTKWWIGDLGVHCTHAALFAKLIINGKNHGLHAFLIPIRDPNTFKTLPGIEVGDIGPKQGFNTKDNGYGRFNNVVIPRRNMFMKYHVVSKEGNYSVQGDEKISYATMLMTRSGINSIAANQFSKIVTIGTKYSLLRKQFKNDKGE